jgi:uncharacterized protein YlxW (UPF0749 family)
VKTPRGQLAVGTVLFILGLLVVMQVRAQTTGSGFEQLSSQDLTTLIANLNLRNDQLRTEVAGLESQLRDLNEDSARGETSVSDLQRSLRRLRLWAGLDPVGGRGVRVRFEGSVTADAVNDVLNELRSAGAEALAVQGVRVVPGTVVAGQPGSLSVEDTALPGRLVVEAIGDPPNLTASLVRPSGIIGRIQAAQPGVAVEVEALDAIQLPATERSLLPADGRPRV